jgi:hypothetical protein
MTSPGQEPTPDPDANAPIAYEHDLPDGTVYREPIPPPRPRFDTYEDARAVSPTLQERHSLKQHAEEGRSSPHDVLVLLARIDSLEAQLDEMTDRRNQLADAVEDLEAQLAALEHALNVTAEQYETERGLVATAHRIVRDKRARSVPVDCWETCSEILAEFAAAGITEPEEPTELPLLIDPEGAAEAAKRPWLMSAGREEPT